MILSSLLTYHRRGLAEGWIPPLYLAEARIDVLVDLASDGRVLGVVDVREAQGPKGPPRGITVIAPVEPVRSSNIRPRLLLDRPDYALGLPEWDKGGPTVKTRAAAARAHAAFCEAHARMLGGHEGPAAALRQALAGGDLAAALAPHLGADLLALLGKKTTRVSFRIEVDGVLELAVELSELRELATQALAADGGDSAGPGRCCVSGQAAEIARVHPKVQVRGVRGSLVSFQAEAFNSHGHEQGGNAPVGRDQVLAYAAALGVLGARTSSSLREGQTVYLWWSEAPTPLESVFECALGGRDEELEGERGEQAIEQALGALRRSAVQDPQATAPFAVLALSARKGRLVTRLWRRGPAGELAADLAAFRAEFALSERGRPYTPSVLGLVYRLISFDDSRGDKSARERLFTSLVPAALERGRPLPPALLYFALRALRPGAVKADAPQAWSRQVAASASAAKAYLNRGRATRTLAPAQELPMSLDPLNNSAPYLLGCLFALQERVQDAAFRLDGVSPGNAALRSRFFNLALSAPVLAISQVTPLVGHYLARLRKHPRGQGTAGFLCRQIDAVIDRLDPVLPRLLTPPEQGEFIVGYHHQRQALMRPATDLRPATAGETATPRPLEQATNGEAA